LNFYYYYLFSIENPRGFRLFYMRSFDLRYMDLLNDDGKNKI